MSDLLNQASLVMVPSGYKEDTVYSVVPSDGSGDLSFTRASNGTRINSAGLVEVCPWNLVPNSEVFALWNTVLIGGSTITVTDNFVTAPNGTLTGAKVVFSTFSDFAQLFQFYSLAPTQNLTATLYAKVPSGTRVCNFGFYDGAFKNQQKTLTTEWQRIEYTGSIDAGTIRACWFYGDGGASNVEVHLWGGQLNVGSTAKPYFPTTDRLNVPRLTYQNGGGGCPSLLLEKQSTNLFTYSEELQTGTSGTITVTPNTAISPDGTQNADSFSTSGYLVKTLSATAGTYTYSVFAKYLSQNTINISIYDGAYYDATYNVITGVVSSASAGVTASIQNFGNGWYRCIMTATTANNVTEVDFNTGNVYVWGCQFEAGSYATSYIQTQSSSATRVADACFKTGISSLIGQTSGVLFVDFYAKGSYDSNNLLMLISSGSGGEIIYLNLVSGTIEAYIAASSAQQFLYTGGTALATNTRHKLAIAYANNDIALYHNGTQLATDTSASIPACSLIRIGDFLGGLYQFGNTINEAVLFKTRLSNSELASLTSL